MNDRLEHAVTWARHRKETRTRRKPSEIYLIRCNGFYKVGIADNPKQRVKELQVGNPYTLNLVRHWLSLDPKSEESKIHKLLEPYHCSGEWFKLPKQLVSFLVGKS